MNVYFYKIKFPKIQYLMKPADTGTVFSVFSESNDRRPEQKFIYK